MTPPVYCTSAALPTTRHPQPADDFCCSVCSALLAIACHVQALRAHWFASPVLNCILVWWCKQAAPALAYPPLSWCALTSGPDGLFSWCQRRRLVLTLCTIVHSLYAGHSHNNWLGWLVGWLQRVWLVGCCRWSPFCVRMACWTVQALPVVVVGCLARHSLPVPCIVGTSPAGRVVPRTVGDWPGSAALAATLCPDLCFQPCAPCAVLALCHASFAWTPGAWPTDSAALLTMPAVPCWQAGLWRRCWAMQVVTFASRPMPEHWPGRLFCTAVSILLEPAQSSRGSSTELLAVPSRALMLHLITAVVAFDARAAAVWCGRPRAA